MDENDVRAFLKFVSEHPSAVEVAKRLKTEKPELFADFEKNAKLVIPSDKEKNQNPQRTGIIFESPADDKAVGAMFKQARNQANLSIRSASKRAGKNTTSQLSNLENGKISPSTRTLAQFAKAIGYELRILIKPL